MTTNTLKLINEFLFDGGFAPGIDVDKLEQEAALIAAAPELLTALESMIVNYAQFGRVTDDFVRQCANLIMKAKI